MILYFSATGNCKYVADRIAQETNDRAISIVDLIKANDYTIDLKKKESLGFISPTYAWGLPIIVKEFLEQIKIHCSNNYLYFIATYGTSPGRAGYFANQLIERQGIAFAAFYSVKMPDTWTPMFDLSNPQKVAKINQRAEGQIDGIINKINTSATGDMMNDKPFAFAADLVYKLGYDSMRETKRLRVEDSCIGCGLCAKNCPINAIAMRDKKPIWVKERCVMCLACLHHCPKFAIQYGENTKKHGQYTHSDFK